MRSTKRYKQSLICKSKRRLDRKLIGLICATVIPINILAVTVSTIAVQESREKMLTAYENDFELYMNRERALFEKLDEWYQNFILQNLQSLTVVDDYSAVKSINMVRTLGDILDIYGIRGFIFLKEWRENQRMYVKGSEGLYTLRQTGALKMPLQEYLEQDTQDNWHLAVIRERYYYFRGYSYQNYHLGFAVDLQAEMKTWLETGVMAKSRILLTDGSVTVMLEREQPPRRLSSAELADNLTAGVGKSIVSCHFGPEYAGMDIYLVSEGLWTFVPAAYLVLQGLAFISGLMLLVLWFFIRRQVVRPLRVLSLGMGKLERQELNYRITAQAATADFEYIYNEFNKMATDILSAHEKELLLYQTQIDNLKLQINPHMLLNSLTMIYSLAETGENRLIQEYSLHLVAYFRYCLRENDTLVPLQSELKFVMNYIEIQKIRFPGEFTLVYTMDDGLGQALVLPLLIQNYVENAMKYARLPSRVIEVLINLHRSGDRLLISIVDTGKGMEEELVRLLNRGEMYIDRNGQKHIGLWNCRRRLEAFYGAEAVIKITSSLGQGTQVWLELPYRGKTEEGGADE